MSRRKRNRKSRDICVDPACLDWPKCQRPEEPRFFVGRGAYLHSSGVGKIVEELMANVLQLEVLQGCQYAVVSVWQDAVYVAKMDREMLFRIYQAGQAMVRLDGKRYIVVHPNCLFVDRGCAKLQYWVHAVNIDGRVSAPTAPEVFTPDELDERIDGVDESDPPADADSKVAKNILLFAWRQIVASHSGQRREQHRAIVRRAGWS